MLARKNQVFKHILLSYCLTTILIDFYGLILREKETSKLASSLAYFQHLPFEQWWAPYVMCSQDLATNSKLRNPEFSTILFTKLFICFHLVSVVVDTKLRRVAPIFQFSQCFTKIFLKPDKNNKTFCEKDPDS